MMPTNSITSSNANTFYVREDGTFEASFGEILLKAEPLGETEGYHFTGTASTSDVDRDGEVLLQKGLNFEPFKEHGEFNWNHVQHALVGVPFGKKAWFENDGWKCEGMILKNLPVDGAYTTDMIVHQHNQLKKSGLGRGLCCSVEGKVTQRSDCGKYIEKADIYNVALTFRPVNPNCSIGLLAKSMGHKAVIKTLSVDDVKPMTKEDLEGGSTLEEKLVKHLLDNGYELAAAKKHVGSLMRKKFLKQ